MNLLINKYRKIDNPITLESGKDYIRQMGWDLVMVKLI